MERRGGLTHDSQIEHLEIEPLMQTKDHWNTLLQIVQNLKMSLYLRDHIPWEEVRSVVLILTLVFFMGNEYK